MQCFLEEIVKKSLEIFLADFGKIGEILGRVPGELSVGFLGGISEEITKGFFLKKFLIRRIPMGSVEEFLENLYCIQKNSRTNF